MTLKLVRVETGEGRSPSYRPPAFILNRHLELLLMTAPYEIPADVPRWALEVEQAG